MIKEVTKDTECTKQLKDTIIKKLLDEFEPILDSIKCLKTLFLMRLTTNTLTQSNL